MSVYDDEKKFTLAPGQGESDRTSKSLKDQEDGATENKSEDAADDKKGDGFRYRHEEAKAKGVAKDAPADTLRGRFKKLKRKRALITGAIGGLGIVVILTIIAFMAGSLIIPNFASSIITYQMERVTRETIATQSRETAQKVAIDSASDSVWTSAKNQYQKLRNNTWGKLDKWRPQKLLQNLEESGKLSFQYSDVKGIGSRVRLERITINGTGVDIPQNIYGTRARIQNPQSYILDRLDSRKALKTAIREAFPNSNFLVRAKIAKALRAKIDARLFRWKASDKNKYKNATEKTTNVANAEESYRVATKGGTAAAGAAETALSDESKKAISEAVEAQNKCYTDPVCTEKAINQGGGLAPEAVNAIENNVGESTFQGIAKKVLGTISPIYGVAVPVCLIYEGSTVKSEDTINRNMEEQQRTFVNTAAAADQQKAGDVTGEEVGAYARQLGQTGRSIPQQRAEAVPVTTRHAFSAEASAGGTYEHNVLETMFGSIAKPVSDVLDGACPVVTNPAVGAGLIALDLIPGIQEGLAAAETVTLSTVSRVIGSQMLNVARNIFTKRTVGKLATTTVATVGAAWLARFYVMSKMGANADGSARDVDFANSADAGGNLYANELDRQQNYGAPLTTKQVSMLNPIDQADRQAQFASQSFYQRYLAITNPGSLMNRTAVAIGTNANLKSFGSFVTSIPRLLNPMGLFSKIGSMIHPLHSIASAASDTDNDNYGNIQWGWTAEEEDAFENNPDYTMLTNQQALDQSGKEDSFSEKYNKCFKDSVGQLLSDGDIQRDTKGTILPDEGDCARNNFGATGGTRDSQGIMHLSFKNADAALAFRWRVAMRYSEDMDRMLDMQEVK